ncbi:MAG TPA: glycosyltransferase [Solirubrobacteraceae bacterium]|nr:glycosyltransferase [Solirubrobacteraceae bacterium]
MIAFGASISGAEAYRRYAQPGIDRAAEPDSQVYAFASVEPIARTYNLILDAAGHRDDLEALVLVHPHTEIVDPQFLTKVRRALEDPAVGIVGSAGASGVRSLAWWEGQVTAAPGRQRYDEFGGGSLPAFSWTRSAPPPAEVEAVDGQLLVLSPWVVRNLRFDESLHYNHGFDVDLCLQARAAGRRVMVADLRLAHHRSIELVKDLDVWAQAHRQLARKWDSVFTEAPSDEAGWKRRARYAEARREACRAIAFSQAMKRDAGVLELERELDLTRASLSWRVTAPLRVAKRWWRSRGEEETGGVREPEGLPAFEGRWELDGAQEAPGRRDTTGRPARV